MNVSFYIMKIILEFDTVNCKLRYLILFCKISKKTYIYLFIFYIYKNGHTDVCLLVCGGLMEIQTPAPILMKFSTHIPTCPRKVLVQV